MNSSNRCFEPLEDCCCKGAPRVLLQSVASLAFNFSASPEKALLAPQTMHSQSNTPRTHLQIFSRMDFFPAY